MATLETALRNAGLQGIIDKLIASAGLSTLTVEAAASGTVIATLSFASSAFASANAGTALAGTMVAGTSSGGGTADHVCFYNSTAAKLATLTLSTATSTDFTLSNLTIGAGDSISCTSLTLTQPAS